MLTRLELVARGNLFDGLVGIGLSTKYAGIIMRSVASTFPA